VAKRAVPKGQKVWKTKRILGQDMYGRVETKVEWDENPDWNYATGRQEVTAKRRRQAAPKKRRASRKR